jgi:hypothetical protein
MPLTDHDATPPPTPLACPWCPYTAVILKQVLHHMEAAHAQRRCDLALSPLIADGGIT